MRQGKRNVGLDLGLCPCIPLPCSSSLSSSSSSSSSSSLSSSSSSDATSFATPPKPRHHIAILHDGRASAFDLTEVQARAILMLARREAGCQDMRPRASLKSRPDGNNREGSTYYLWSPGGVSMKRSLQRFLQGRRSRRAHAQEISPYNDRITTNTATNHHRSDSGDNQS